MSSEANSGTFISRVETLMEMKKVNKSQLAAAIGTKYHRLNQWWRTGGLPNSEDLVRLADYFHVPEKHLVTGSPTLEELSKSNRLNERLATLDGQELVELEKYLDYLVSQRD